MYCFAFLLLSFSFMVAFVNDQCYSDGQPIPQNVGLSLLTCPSICQKRLQEMAIGQLPQFDQPFDQLFQTMVNLPHGWSMCPTFKSSHHRRSTFPTTGKLYSLLGADYSRVLLNQYHSWSICPNFFQRWDNFWNSGSTYPENGQPVPKGGQLVQLLSTFLTVGQSSHTGWSTLTLIKSSLSSTCPTLCQLVWPFQSMVDSSIVWSTIMVNPYHGWSMCPMFKSSHHRRSTFPTTGQLYSLLWANYSRVGQSVPTFSNDETIFGTVGQPFQRMVNLSQRVVNLSTFVSTFLTVHNVQIGQYGSLWREVQDQ